LKVHLHITHILKNLLSSDEQICRYWSLLKPFTGDASSNNTLLSGLFGVPQIMKWHNCWDGKNVGVSNYFGYKKIGFQIFLMVLKFLGVKICEVSKLTFLGVKFL
jgi:hypothetical protein